MVKNLPARWETWFQSLGWEDPLEKGMATQSSILAWGIPWTEEPGRLQSMGSQRGGLEDSYTTERLSLSPCSVALKVLKVAELTDILPLKINVIPFEFLTIFHL